MTREHGPRTQVLLKTYNTACEKSNCRLGLKVRFIGSPDAECTYFHAVTSSCKILFQFHYRMGCRVAQLVKCLVTSGYPDGSSSGGPGSNPGEDENF